MDGTGALPFVGDGCNSWTASVALSITYSKPVLWLEVLIHRLYAAEISVVDVREPFCSSRILDSFVKPLSLGC